LAKIRQLDPHVADLIAAGEVVDRPASVVKELVENAIDAGATLVTVEIRGGGLTYIRVTDNGCGIEPEDAETAFLRHATSKLRDERGLEAIQTLGFRGEALAAIAAVSRVELRTRVPGAAEGVRLVLEGGAVTEKEIAGCPDGTTLIVRNLFYNTPARLKFMKSDRAEAAAVSSVMTACALSHPEVSFRYIRDGKEEFHTPGDGKPDSCVYTLFGRDFAADLIPCETEDGGLTVSGYVCAPHGARGNRSYQYFFVNGRAVRSKTLQAALEQAYKNSLFTGRYPSCVLYITLRWSEVDVNVHPAKTEVKFLNERKVFDGVYYAALSALSRGSGVPALRPEAKPEGGKAPVEKAPEGDGEKDADIPQIFLPAFPEKGGFSPVRDGLAPGYRAKGSPGSASAPVLKIRPGGLDKNADGALAHSLFREPSLHAGAKGRAAGEEKPRPDVFQKEAGPAPFPPAEPEEAEPKAAPETEDITFRYVGEAYGTYIIVEYNEGLWLIDKHAAHERMHFDRLKSQDYAPMAQMLLEPVVCRLGREDAALLFENEELFNRLGFAVEPFGEEAVAVRQIPSDIRQQDAEAALCEILEALRQGGKVSALDRLDKVLHTIACKAAIKAGTSSDPETLHQLIVNVLTGKVRYCPHGRPVAVEWTKSAIDRSFKRT